MDADWGRYTPRWEPIRSEYLDVAGLNTHVLWAEHGRAAGACDGTDAPLHLLVHPMASSAAAWLDVMAELRGHGPVIAPDLPGALFGGTELPHPKWGRAVPSAQFLRELLHRLDHARVVVHGWSFGGTIALLLADRIPERIAGMVLTNPALPGDMGRLQEVGWRTVGRAGMSLAEPPLRGLVALPWTRLMLGHRPVIDPDRLAAARLRMLGGETTRCSPEQIGLFSEQVRTLHDHPRRRAAAVTVGASALASMLTERDALLRVIDRLSTPVLLISGGVDPVIGRERIEALTGRRPDWTHFGEPTAGHMLPWEIPARYAAEVTRWYRDSGPATDA
jgi:pimeloyl-ACP methyl ester carboxylesterase